MRKLRHLLEALGLHLLFTAFRLMPLDMASFMGGFMARAVGPMLPAHQTAKKNLRMVFPEKTEAEIQKILAGMWDNLGRTAAEMPNLPNQKLLDRVEHHGLENMRKHGLPAIFISAHIGNWELTYPLVYNDGIPVALFYRQANNPYADIVINRLRAAYSARIYSKNKRGAAGMTKAINDGESMALLIDQKMNEGIAVPFFGRPAMTAAIVGVLALRYNLPIIPGRVIRTKGAHFIANIYPPIQYEKTGDNEKDTLAIMTRVNEVIESWVREYPEQWFWVHKRWPKEMSS